MSEMTISADLIVFGLLAAASVTAGVITVACSRVVFGSFALLAAGVSVAALIGLFLQAPFLAAAIVVLHGGMALATSIYAVKLLEGGKLDGEFSALSRTRAVATAVAVIGLVATLCFAVASFDGAAQNQVAAEAGATGRVLAEEFLAPFVTTAFILLAALVGVFTATRERVPGAGRDSPQSR